jgi:SAM-dependent methyltransferase
MYSPVIDLARAFLPSAQRRWLRQRLRRLRRPAVLGTIRRTTPLSDGWGVDRGTPVDRRFIEQFLAEHRNDIRGHVLEIKNSRYTDRFGLEVERRSVLDIDPSNAAATICADLAAAHTIPSDHFDCFILTQTLQFIFDTRAALGHAHRILRSGGVLLATVPSISRIDRELSEIDYWRFTAAACKTLFQELFAADQLTIRTYGNVLSGTAFWNGMAAEELSSDELDFRDDRFPVIIAIRAVKV